MKSRRTRTRQLRALRQARRLPAIFGRGSIGVGNALEEEGISFDFFYLTDLQGNPTGGLQQSKAGWGRIRGTMAATIEDGLARRLGIQLYSWRTAIEAAPVVVFLMAAELGWSDAATHTAITGYVEKIHHLLDAAGLPRKRSSATAD